MKYVLLYVAIGAITALATLVQERSARKKHGPSIGDMLYDLTREKASFWKRFSHEFLLPALTGLAVICFWPFAIFLLVRHASAERQRRIREEERRFRVREENLVEQLSIKEIELRELVYDPLGGVPEKPFGHLWPAWRTFADGLDADSTLWSFAATDNSGYEPVRVEGYIHFTKKDIQPMFVTIRKSLFEAEI